MIFSKLTMYKVVEFPGGIAIINQHDNLTTPGAVPLICGDGATVPEYLDRYIHAREKGKEIVAAHREAMLGTKMIEPGHLDEDNVVHSFGQQNLAKRH